jgi:hypothetical protein
LGEAHCYALVDVSGRVASRFARGGEGSEDAPPRGRENARGEPLDGFSVVQQETGSCGLAVFGSKGPQVRRIPQARSSGRLDLDWDEMAIGFNDEVDLIAGCRPPVEDLGTVDACISPCSEVVVHEVLQMCTGGLFLPGEGHGEAGVAPIDLGRFDEAFCAVHRIGRKPGQHV